MTRRLLLLNGLAAFGVAQFHAAAYGFSALFLWTDRYLPVTVPNYDQLGSFSFYMLLVVRQLDAFVIPAFIFISGYFVAFAAGGKDGMKWATVGARIKSFLIPLTIWTVIRFILLRQLPASLHDILRPYYFIVLLIQFYALSPFIVPLAKERWKLLLIIAFVIHAGAESVFFFDTLGYELPAFLQQIKRMLPLWFFPLRIFWFSLGVVAGFHRQAFTQFLHKYRWLLLGTALLLAPLTIVEYEVFSRLSDQPWLGPSFRGFLSKIYALAFIFAFLAFDKAKIPFTKSLNDLGGKSLGIYLANIPVIYVLGVLMYKKTPWILGNQILYQTILVTLGLAIPLLMMKFVKQSRFRWAYKYLFG